MLLLLPLGKIKMNKTLMWHFE